MLLFSSLLLTLTSVTAEKSKFLTTYVGLQNDLNLGHSGYTYLPSEPQIPELKLSTCQYVDLNITTCDTYYRTLKNRAGSLVVRAWVAVTLRNNILSFVSYLLHQLKEKFSEDVDTSLLIIYDEIRKNHIRMMDFIPKVKSIARMERETQLVALFKNLQSVMQPFCKSELELLARTMYKLKKSESRVNNIYAYSKNDEKIKYHEIDLFNDISYQTMILLQGKSFSKPSELSQEINRSFGREFSSLFHLIKVGKILLTQPVLAALTANMKFVELTPKEIEDLRFLIDVLRGNKVNHWSPELIGLTHVRSPHSLVENMLQSLANNNDVDPLLSEIAAGLQDKVQRSQRSYMTKAMERFFNEEEFNITLIFEVMVKNVQNKSSVNLLKNLFDDGTINPFYALKGFVRYYYNSPVRLAIGFLRRLQLRTPVNTEVMDLMRRIIDDLSGSKRPRDFSQPGKEDINRKEEAKFDRNHLLRFKNELIKPKSPFDQDVCSLKHDETPTLRFEPVQNQTEICETPPTPSMNWIQKIDQPAYNLDLKALIAEASLFLSDFIDKNKEISNFIEGLLINEPIAASMEIGLKSITYRGSIRQLLIHLFKKLINVNKVRARSLIYFEVIKIYCRLINDHDNHTFDASSFKLDDPAKSDSIDKFRAIVSFPLQKLIDTYNLSSHSAIFWNNYTTNRQLVSDLCRAYLTHKDVLANNDLFDELVFIMHSVYHVPVKFAELLSIFTVNTVYEIRDLNLAQDLLRNPNMMQMLGDDFDLARYPTKGVMLKAVFRRMRYHEIVKRNVTLLIAVETQLRKITCSGHWMESSEAIVRDALRDQVDIDKVFDLGLDREKLSPVVKNAFMNMWNWYGGIFNPINYIKNMNISGYNTRSQFIQGFLNSISRNVADDYTKVREDVKLMRSAILETGNGLDPVDFL